MKAIKYFLLGCIAAVIFLLANSPAKAAEPVPMVTSESCVRLADEMQEVFSARLAGVPQPVTDELFTKHPENVDISTYLDSFTKTVYNIDLKSSLFLESANMAAQQQQNLCMQKALINEYLKTYEDTVKMDMKGTV